MKKIIIALLALVILTVSLASCSSNPPELDEVKDELVSLIEASYEINDIFFGEGLATYERGGKFDKEHHLYDENDNEYAYYEYVAEDSEYLFTEQIKWAAEKVYTTDYLEGVYTMAFDGYADENTGNVTTARYLDAGGWLLKYAFGEADPFNILPGKRVYVFETMEIVKPSTAQYLNVAINSHLEGEESETLTVTLRFKLTEDGWRLDSPSY